MAGTGIDSLWQALEEGGVAFHTVANALPEMVWTATADGTIDFFNRRWIEYTGQTVADVQHSTGTHSVHPEEIDSVKARWAEAVAAGRPFEMEYRLHSAADGSYRWFLARAQPLRDVSGVRMWVGTATDIDVQKRSNENLHFVLEASNLLARAQSVQAISDEFARLAVQRFADWCVVILRGEDGRYGVSSLQHRDPDKVRLVNAYVERYPIADERAFISALERHEPVLLRRITDAMLAQAAKDEEHLALLHRLGMHSAIVAPLHADGQTLGGVIMYTAESRRTFSEADVDVLTILTDHAAAALSRVRTLSQEQRARRQLQFLAHATESIYESLDLTAAFGELVRLIVSTFGGFAVAARIERSDAVRVLAAAHSDPEKDDAARSLVGVRPFHPEAEKKFVAELRKHKTIVQPLDSDVVARSTWPYLSNEMQVLAPTALITIPLHSRGKTYGAIVAYSIDPKQEFSSEEIELLMEIGRSASVAMENAQVFERERRIAQTLQDSLLPPSLPKLQNMRFDAVYLPAASDAQVGGDWYDAFELEDGSVVITAGDVAGRGPAAAVIMGKVRNLLAIAPSYERDPARILDTVEDVLARRYVDTIVTAFLGIIDADRRTLRYANAGHPYPLLRRRNSLEEIRAEGLPIGLRRSGPPSQSRHVELQDARMIVLYTDGLVEATHDVLTGQARLAEVVESEAVLHTHSPSRFIEESILRSGCDDDVAILTIAFEMSVRWAFDAENARAAQDARAQFVRHLRGNTRDETGVAMAELIFGELVGNVVRHSPGAIDIDLEWADESPVLHVIDRGSPFALRETLPRDVLSESGRGLFIVGQLGRNLRVEHVAGYGNHVVVELPLRRAQTS